MRATDRNLPAPNASKLLFQYFQKLKIALEELNETSVWLGIVCQAELMTTDITARFQQMRREKMSAVYGSLPVSSPRLAARPT